MDKDFITILNSEIVGKASLREGYYNTNPNNSCLWAGIKIEIIEKDRYRLISGWKDYNGDFYSCPLQLKYIQLNNLYSDVSVINQNLITGTIIVFSKDYTKQYPIRLNLKSYNGLQNRVSTNYLADLINILNQYISKNGDISILNELAFQVENLNLIPTEKSSILYQINKLEFKYFSNDSNSIGKDSLYWNEIEIRNLPQNNYLKRIFVEIISNSKKFDSVNYNLQTDIIFITYGREHAFCKTNGRKEMNQNICQGQEVTDILKVDLNKFYSSEEEVFDRIVKPN